MEKGYMVKEVIFGTRKQMLIVQDLLRRLKSMTMISDKEVSDFEYYVSLDSELKVKFYQNMQTLRGLLVKLNLVQLVSKDMEGVVRRIAWRNAIVSSRYRVYIKEEFQDEFESVRKELLESDFLNLILFGKLKENCFGTVEMYKDRIYFMDGMGINFFNYGFYDAKLDRINLACFGGSLLDDDIRYLMNMEVDADSLSSYHRYLIDSSNSAKKNVIIDDFSSDLKREYDIFEKENEIILSRVRK